ncbi:MAG: cupin domain-containing protein [Candidatus Tectomicrobia bacterium]|nr:cupin domain-containing protein [Candidatus Tectomicrobia bacterium]
MIDVRRVDSCKAFNPEKMNKVNLFETDRMFCDLYCFEPGQEQKVHAHAGSDKVYFVLEGCGTIHLAGESEELAAGSTVVAASGVEHGVTNTSRDRLVLLVYMAPKP